jgi:hypothetical protein
MPTGVNCANLNTMSFISGAAISVTGLDRMFTGFGAPPGVHWALGGIGADYYCKKAISPDKTTAMAAAAAYAGGFVATMMLGR